MKLFKATSTDVKDEILTMSKASTCPPQLSHSNNILELVGVVIHDLDPYSDPQVAIVSRYMSNGSLHDMLINSQSPYFRASPLPLVDVLSFALQASHGVVCLHAAGISHRDLAARNLLVDDSLTVFVSDFGFARLRGGAESKGFTATHVGPIRWEAPESLASLPKEYSEKSDVFSFGVCLYELFVREEPYSESSNPQVCRMVLSGERMRVPLGVDPAVAAVMGKCWAQRAADRPAMRAVHKALRERRHSVQSERIDVEREGDIVAALKRGGVFQKIPFKKGGMNRFQSRFFKVADDLRKVIWVKEYGINKMRAPSEKSCLFCDIVAVKIGVNSSPNFRRFFGIESGGSAVRARRDGGGRREFACVCVCVSKSFSLLSYSSTVCLLLLIAIIIVVERSAASFLHPKGNIFYPNEGPFHRHNLPEF